MLSELPALAKRWSKAFAERAKRSRDVIGAYSARIKAVEALLKVRNADLPQTAELSAAAKRLEAVAPSFGGAPTNDTYAAPADLLAIIVFLVEWQAAILNATPDADRFVRAARERAACWIRKNGDDPQLKSLRAIAENIGKISTTTDAKEVINALSATPLPVGLFHVEARRFNPTITDDDNEPTKPEKLAVAFLEFKINGQPVSEVHHVPPGVVHDLDITVKVSYWPSDAARLMLKPVSVENTSLYELPNFAFEKPSGEGPYRLPGQGRALLKVPQAIHARPLEFRYLAEFEPPSVPQPVEVVGQRTLRLEAGDWRHQPQTGYPNLDGKIIELRNELRRLGVPEAEISDGVKIAVTLGKLMGQSLQDNMFNGQWPEKKFQTETRKFLRSEPAIGSALQEHPQSAGGILDLSFQNIPIELKAETEHNLSLADCSKFIEQTTSYAVGGGKRLCILCVLDTSPKNCAAFPAEEGLGILYKITPKGHVPVITMLIQGNLTQPSLLSKKPKRSRKPKT